MARFIFIFIVGSLVGIFVILIAQANWVKGELDAERDSISKYFGEGTAQIVEGRTEIFFNDWFIETGAVENTYSFLLFNESLLRKIISKLAPGALVWLKERVEAFWWLIYQSVFRAFMAVYWLPYLLPLFAAGVLDGLMQRKIKKVDFEYANTVHYHIAWNIITALMIVPVLYLLLPISVHPLIIPIWSVSLAAAMALLSSSLQHRL